MQEERKPAEPGTQRGRSRQVISPRSLPTRLITDNSDRTKTHWLLTAPPRSQSHGRQPLMSLLRPQCSSWKQESRLTRVAESFSVGKEAFKAVTGSRFDLHVPFKGNKHTHTFGLVSLWGLSLRSCIPDSSSDVQKRSIFSYHALVAVSSGR